MRYIAILALLVVVQATSAESIFIGQNELPLGDDAFAISAECLEPHANARGETFS